MGIWTSADDRTASGKTGEAQWQGVVMSGVGEVYDIFKSEACSEAMCNVESNGCLELSLYRKLLPMLSSKCVCVLRYRRLRVLS